MKRLWGVVVALGLAWASPGWSQDKEPIRGIGAPCHAISFDGGGRVRVPHSESLAGGGPMTIEAWVRPYAASFDPSQGYPNLIGKRDTSGIYPPWVLGLWKDGEVYGVSDVYEAPDAQWRHGTVRLPDRAWSHVAVVFDGERLRFFVNGKLDAEFASRAMGPPNKEEIIIGQLLNSQQPFPGDVAAVRVSKVARYREGFKPEARWAADEGTLLLMMFDEGAGESVKDLSSHGNHGRIEGATWIREAPGCRNR